jgi:hypothetical protein
MEKTKDTQFEKKVEMDAKKDSEVPEDLSDPEAQFREATKYILGTWTPIAGALQTGWGSHERKTNLSDIKVLIENWDQYKFENMSTFELFDVLVEELCLFIEETESGNQEVEDFLWVYCFEVMNIYIEVEEKENKGMKDVADLIVRLSKSVENEEFELCQNVINSRKKVYEKIKENADKFSGIKLNEIGDHSSHEGSSESEDELLNEEEMKKIDQELETGGRLGARKKKKKKQIVLSSDDEIEIEMPKFEMPKSGKWVQK